MSKQTWKGSTLLSPVPCVLVGSGTMENPNVFTVGWTGIINSKPPKTYISVRPERFSHKLISETGEFTINLPTESLVRAVDFCGVRTGAKVNKFEKCNLTPENATQIDAPMIKECPVSLECRVFDTIKLGSHDMFLADILTVNVDEKLLNEDGKLCLNKAKLIAYSHGDYLALGRKLGNFGYSVRKKPKNKK